MTDTDPAAVRSASTKDERRALQQLWKMYADGDAGHSTVRNPHQASLISAVQSADVNGKGYTDRARGISVQVMQAAGELMALGPKAKPAEVIARKRTLLRRLRTVEILQFKGLWFE